MVTETEEQSIEKDQELTPNDELEVFRRASVCRSFKLNGLQEILQRTDAPITPMELIWQVGDLNAKDYLSIDNNISHYVVNRQKAEETIQKIPENSLCRYHDAWHDWYREEFERTFFVEDLGALLYHESTYLKKCAGRDKSILDILQKKVQDYLLMYCRFVAQELKIPLTVSINDLKEVFTTLLAHISVEHQEKRTEVADYITKLIQQFRRIKEANMFKRILSESEYESFIGFLNSLNPFNDSDSFTD